MEIIVKSDCPYYPCSSADEHVCNLCFCSMFPCKIPETGGKWFTTPQGFMIWDCTSCWVSHEKSVVEMLNLDKNEMDEKKLQIAKGKLRIYLNEL